MCLLSILFYGTAEQAGRVNSKTFSHHAVQVHTADVSSSKTQNPYDNAELQSHPEVNLSSGNQAIFTDCIFYFDNISASSHRSHWRDRTSYSKDSHLNPPCAEYRVFTLIFLLQLDIARHESFHCKHPAVAFQIPDLVQKPEVVCMLKALPLWRTTDATLLGKSTHTCSNISQCFIIGTRQERYIHKPSPSSSNKCISYTGTQTRVSLFACVATLW